MNANRPTTILDTVDIGCVLFLDIETVPCYPDFGQLPENFKNLWRQKSRKYDYEQLSAEELYFMKAGIHAEFGRIICISVGYFHQQENGYIFRTKSYYEENEAQLLLSFRALLDSHFNDCNKHFLCAHNGLEFDFPYIARRMMINNVKLPLLLNVSGTKSWSNRWLIDTLDLWRFGDYKEKCSLDLLAACFNIESPKTDITGADVARVYWVEQNLLRIMEYCQRDVVTLARIFQVFKALAPVEERDVVYI